MNKQLPTTYYVLALAVAIGLLFHGASFFNTLEDTYDIYVHLFFADHYNRAWFDPWEYKWYTGFSMISYPPLVHQLIALLGFIGGLKFGVYLLSFGIVVLYVTGAYRFAKLITINSEAASYAALIAVFLPSVVEAFHVFGQIPMMMGISWLLHALPEVYLFIRHGKFTNYLRAISIIAVAVCSHHVTPIFGMVFFVVPLMGTAIMDGAREERGSYARIRIVDFVKYALRYLRRIVGFGLSTILVAIFVILPYWIWSKNDPISQVPIPHGSRDNFIEVFSSGLVFFIIPWGFLILMLPYYFYRFFSKRNLFLGLSFTLLIILGTGGTTPIPKILLGENAFNILTLERFTFWATIYAMPLAGEFLWHFVKGTIYKMIMTHRSKIIHGFYVSVIIICVFLSSGFTMNLGFFRPLQPKSIEVTPLINFLESDKHYKWRYLTLGFGDQMAWLSANTRALTIDGNYHSARRVPELTTRAIERLENAKYRGVEGIGTLQQFLTSPQNFHLKYIFSNDKFYDPLLYFSGWHRVKLLSNGIYVWEKADVSTLPSVLPKNDIPNYQRLMWGIVPLTCLLLAFFFNVQLHWINHIRNRETPSLSYQNPEVGRPIIEPVLYYLNKYWILMVLILASVLVGNLYFLNLKQVNPERVVISFYDAMDYKKFEQAHSLIDPSEGVTLDYFLLETSVTDGMVDSYGKINSIVTTVLEKNDHYAKIKTHITWITPMDVYDKILIHETIKKGLKWYIKSIPTNNYIPTNQFSTKTEVSFLNQGRRKITTKETYHEDILDRPVVSINEANLIQSDSNFHIVGFIQNLDNYPADVTLKASLFDDSGTILTSHYDDYTIIHKLLPKEVSPFRIDFESVAWLNKKTIAKIPASFTLELLASVTTQDLYKEVAIQGIKIDKNTLKGELYNRGHSTATITQLLFSYISPDDLLVWVESKIVEKSTFPSKVNPFNLELTYPGNYRVINSEKTLLSNGLDNALITTKYRVNSKPENRRTDLTWVNGQVGIYANNYIGNPGPF